MKNEDLIKIFVSTNKKANTKHLFIENNVLYSYGYHYPLCIKLSNSDFLINKDKYSMTTSRHKSLLLKNLSVPNKVLYLKTEEIKEFLYSNIKTIDEVEHHRFFKSLS